MQRPRFPKEQMYIQSAEGLTVREKLAWMLAGIIIIGGGVILIRRAVRKQQANIQHRLTYEDGSAAAFAKQVKMAFDNDGWWGTDTPSLRKTIIRIPTKLIFRQVIDSYGRMYNRSMMEDMESELQSSEYNEILAIISSKPDRTVTQGGAANLTPAHYQTWAARLNAAFNKSYGVIPGTDEEAIRTVFTEIPTQTAFSQTASAYRSIYGRELASDLKSELEFWEYAPFLQIIQKKPQ